MSKKGSEYDYFKNGVDSTEESTDWTDKRWIRCNEATKRYGVSRPTVIKWAINANSYHKIDETILIDYKGVDRYIESFRVPGGVY